MEVMCAALNGPIGGLISYYYFLFPFSLLSLFFVFLE